VRKLVWFLVVLAVLAVGADRGAAYLAERTLADRVQQRADLTSTPDVHIAGFPFLTQVYRGRYDEITVTARQVPVGEGGQRLVLGRLALTFDDVTTDRQFRTFRAATGHATARIPYADLGRVLGLQLRYAGGGSVEATKQITVAGETVRPSFTLEPKVLDGALEFGGRLAGDLPQPVRTELQSALGLEVPLDGLPFGIRATGLAAKPGGIVLQLAGKDLRYTR
jgi:hypothetical protein